jgi:hypothetical protein
MGLAIPRQRSRIALTSVRLEFGPDISLECPHAPSPSVNKKQRKSKCMKATCVKARFSKLIRFLSVMCLIVWAIAPRAPAQTPPVLDVHLYAGLTITGAVGTVYSVEYVTDLAQTNTPSAWRCLEFLQLPASPYLWADKSARPRASDSIGRGRFRPRRT